MSFKLDEHGFSWTMRCRLSSWAGYLDRSGIYGGAGQQQASDGTVEIVFAPEGRDNSPLQADELLLVRWFLDNEARVYDAVKMAIVDAYPNLISGYGRSAEEQAELLPDYLDCDGMQRLIGLYAVNVHQTRKGDEPYLGFEFGCTWDAEHGLGVLTHGSRVVRVGGADTAILLWMSEEDAQLT